MILWVSILFSQITIRANYLPSLQGFSNFLNEPHEWEDDNTRKTAESSMQIVREIRAEIVKIWEAHSDLLNDLRYSMKKW